MAENSHIKDWENHPNRRGLRLYVGNREGKVSALFIKRTVRPEGEKLHVGVEKEGHPVKLEPEAIGRAVLKHMGIES
ncbi:hypothetical protein [Pseudodesulfovibrio tunisiensis]|uniref:hypothetical protein n=1 Tax=Pseudodesulfovibrio tunisiensis TaxID=463192 RepID=UPI001FB24D94|nr:hypothetical protein [Pseudodesulfovibrio tunisiensis]